MAEDVVVTVISDDVEGNSHVRNFKERELGEMLLFFDAQLKNPEVKLVRTSHHGRLRMGLNLWIQKK